MAKSKKKKKSKQVERQASPSYTQIRNAGSGPKAKSLINRNYGYDGAQYNRLWKDWVTGQRSANTEIYGVLCLIRDRCRDLVRNNPYAKGALNIIVDNVLGAEGFSFQSKVMKQRGEGFNADACRAIEMLLEEWFMKDNCDVAGRLDFRQLSRLILFTWAESGEVLIRKRKMMGPSQIPFQLQILEPDYFADELEITLKNNNTSRIEMGVQLDQYGKVEGYWLYKQHPGDRLTNVKVNRHEVEFVPADEIYHLFICERPEQIRGVPWLASAVKRLHFLADTEEAELVAMKLASFIGGVIKSSNDRDPFSDSIAVTDNGDGTTTTTQNAGDATGPGQFRDFEPGMFLRLFDNEEVQTFDSTRPNSGLEAFTKHVLRGISVGLPGVSYCALAGDFTDASYSSNRAERLSIQNSIAALQMEFKAQFHQLLIPEILDISYLTGKISLPGYESQHRNYCKHRWGSPAIPWMDPKTDIEAAVLAIESKLSTYTRELAKQNIDFEDLVQELAREQEMLRQAGLIPQESQKEQEEVSQLSEGLAAVRSILENQGQEVLQAIQSSNNEHLLSAIVARSLEPSPAPAVVEVQPVITPEIDRASGKNCNKGKPCGGSCISKKKVCFKGLSDKEVALAKKARKSMKSGADPVSSELPNPESPSEPSASSAPANSPDPLQIAEETSGKPTAVEEIGLDELDARRAKLYDKFFDADQPSPSEYDVFVGSEGEPMAVSMDGRLVPPAMTDEMSMEALEVLESEWNGVSITVGVTINGSYEDVGLTRQSAVKATRSTVKMWRELEGKLEPGTLVSNVPTGGRGGKRDFFYQKFGFGRVPDNSNIQHGIVGKDGKIKPFEMEPVTDYKKER